MPEFCSPKEEVKDTYTPTFVGSQIMCSTEVRKGGRDGVGKKTYMFGGVEEQLVQLI